MLLFEDLCLNIPFPILNNIEINIFVGGSGDAGAVGGPPISGRGATRGKRILPADIFVTKPSHIVNKKGK